MHTCGLLFEHILVENKAGYTAIQSRTVGQEQYCENCLEFNKAVYTIRSRVRVGGGSDEIDQLDGLAGAVTPKPPVNAEKS